jgi:hypothetical protein
MPKNIVWVLGSGFSQPLGGPTLADLFSAESYLNQLASFRGLALKPTEWETDVPGELLGAWRTETMSEEQWALLKRATDNAKAPATMCARRLFLYGTRFERGVIDQHDRDLRDQQRGEALWKDAEEFLDQLESAAVDLGGPLALRLRLILTRGLRQGGDLKPTPELRAVRNAARRMLAMECSRFLLNADIGSERWSPYRDWSGELLRKTGHSHTIVSFNYDVVLEMLGMQDCVQLPGKSPLRIPAGLPLILKPHGSVDWKRVGDDVVHEREPLFCATCRDEELAIAPPGPEKIRIAAGFGDLWAKAKTRLRTADAVVFMGYRFPESDATARSELIGALSRSRELKLHIVLGPDRNHLHVARLRALLRWRCPSARIYVHPLYAQDFMSMWRDRDLTAPPAAWTEFA